MGFHKYLRLLPMSLVAIALVLTSSCSENMQGLFNSGELYADWGGPSEYIDLGTISLRGDTEPEVSEVHVIGVRDGSLLLRDIYCTSDPTISDLVTVSYEGQGSTIHMESGDELPFTVSFNPTSTGTYVFSIGINHNTPKSPNPFFGYFYVVIQ